MKASEQSVPAGTHATDVELADRLERLSAPLAEKVLQTAIELHQQDTFDDTSVAWDEVESIGLELGIGRETLRRALREALETEHDAKPTSLFSKLFGPDEISGGILAPGDPDVVRTHLKQWMADLEGMAPVRQEGSTTAWEATQTPSSNAAALRHNGTILTRQTGIDGEDQLIEMTVSTSKVKTIAKVLLLLCTATGTLLGALLAGFGTNAPDFLPGILEFFLPFLGFSAGGLGVAVVAARMSLRTIRDGVKRALSGVASLAGADAQ